MSKKRSFSITVTMREGYGDPMTFTGVEAEDILSAYTHQYDAGCTNFIMHTVTKGSDSTVTECYFDVRNVAKICRTQIQETESEDGKCKDITVGA